MRIAVLFDTYLKDRKGLYNAVINRTKSLMSVSDDCIIDMYCLQAQPAGLNRHVRQDYRKEFGDELNTDGLTFRILWYKRYMTDDVLLNRLHKPPLLFRRWVKRNMTVLADYDLITAHSARCGEMARLVNEKYGIPYCVTWHGTDIHTTPFLSSSMKQYITGILKGAACNFFVGGMLMKKAQSFASGFKGEILYNGVSESFRKYDYQMRQNVRSKYGVPKGKVVAYVGNLIQVKNVAVLPDIFYEVKRKYQEEVSFWLIGDGVQKPLVENGLKEKKIEGVFLGNRPFAEMPDMMNCIDVLVLPSKNESFGLVLVEAMACGANAVGSNAGGIPEVIGEENTCELDKGFVSNISNRIVYFLTNDVQQMVKKPFSWKETAQKEYSLYKQILSS